MDARIVVDIDDTICTNVRKLPYDQCVPAENVIKDLNYLHDELGYTIVLYTARGMVSCNGDLKRIIEKNRDTLLEWLKKYDVHYDEIVFGKPIGDLYIDDKALDVRDFRKEDFYNMTGGGSGKGVCRLGNIVKKDLGDDVENFKDWIEDNQGACDYPRVISYLYNEVTMEYIDGTNLCDVCNGYDLGRLMAIIERFSEKKMDSFDMEVQLSILRKNKTGGEFDSTIDNCETLMRRYQDAFEPTYCHGDLTLSNVLLCEKGLCFIDPRYNRKASSYLLDYGKLRMSLMNYERRFGITKADNSVYLGTFDNIMGQKGIYAPVLAANLMYICRLYRYKENKAAVVEMANELMKGAQDVF